MSLTFLFYVYWFTSVPLLKLVQCVVREDICICMWQKVSNDWSIYLDKALWLVDNVGMTAQGQHMITNTTLCIWLQKTDQHSSLGCGTLAQRQPSQCSVHQNNWVRVRISSNYHNYHIPLPLTLLKVSSEHRFTSDYWLDTIFVNI